MAKLILCVFVVSFIGATLAQDFEPPLLEGPKTTTLEPLTTPAAETPATKIPATETPATETPATETPATETPAEKTDAPSTKTPKTTTKAATEPVTDSPFSTTQKTTTTPKATTSSTTTRMPTTRKTTTREPATWYPNTPNFNNSPCYYKTQQGFPLMRWNCGRFEYVTPIECFRCCLYSIKYFAGCYRVHNYFCQTNNVRGHNDFNYFK